MYIVVVNKTVGLSPEIPNACVVKIATSPFTIVGGRSFEEKLVAQASSLRAAVREMVNRVNKIVSERGEEHLCYFVEVESDLPEKLTMKIALFDKDGSISEPVVTLEKGKQFALREGVKITVAGLSLGSTQDFERLKDMLEMARFVGYELN